MDVSAPELCGLNTNCYIMNECFSQRIKISSWPLLHHHLISGARSFQAQQYLSIFPSEHYAWWEQEEKLIYLPLLSHEICACTIVMRSICLLYHHCSYTHIMMSSESECKDDDDREIWMLLSLTADGHPTNTSSWLVNLMNKSLSTTPNPNTHQFIAHHNWWHPLPPHPTLLTSPITRSGHVCLHVPRPIFTVPFIMQSQSLWVSTSRY